MKIKIEASHLQNLKEDLNRADTMVEYLTEHLRAYADAAEFESRVVEMIMTKRNELVPCNEGWNHCPIINCHKGYPHLDPVECMFTESPSSFCVLYHARLAVEDEMERIENEEQHTQQQTQAM